MDNHMQQHVTASVNISQPGGCTVKKLGEMVVISVADSGRHCTV